MGIYKTYSCPKCRKHLIQLVALGSKGVGEPFVKCQSCGTFVVVTELFNEWELLSDWEKREMRRRAIWTALQSGGLSGGIVGMLIASSVFLEAVSDQPILLAFFIVGLGLVGFYGHYFFVKRGLEAAIERSNKRMQDPAHRSALAALRISSAQPEHRGSTSA